MRITKFISTATLSFICAGKLLAFPFSNGDAASIALGQKGLSVSGINTASGKSLHTPSAIATGKGRVYACDTDNNRVLWWSETAFFSGKDAEGVLGQADMEQTYANRGGSASASTLSGPKALALDSAGNVWVADTQNHRVLLYLMPTTNGQPAALVLGQADFLSNSANRNGTADAGTLYLPLSLVSDDSGNLWVSDAANQRILRYDAPHSNGQNASLVLGKANFSDVASYSASAATTGRVDGLALDSSGALWAADYYNHRILRYNPPFSSGQAAALVLGQTSFTERTFSTDENKLYYPYRLSFDTSGFLWVSDTNNNRILKFSPPFSTGQSATLVLGQDDFLSAGTNHGSGSPSAAGFNAPLGLTFHGGNLLVADSANNRILRWPVPSAAADFVAGQKDFTSSGKNRVTASGSYSPTDIALSTVTGRIYIADRRNNRILWWNNADNLSTGQAADGVLGQADFTDSSTNRGENTPSASGLSDPFSVCLDGPGNIWVADYGNHRVLRYSSPHSSGQAADIVLGQGDFISGDPNRGGTTGTDTLYNPTHVSVDKAGSLWVTDRNNNRVLKFTPPFSNGQAAALVLGQPDMNASTGNNGGISASSLLRPFSAVPDGEGNIWVADSRNYRLLAYTAPNANGQAAATVLGQPDFNSGTVQTIGAGTLNIPSDIAVTETGELWVSDTGYNRILRFSAPYANGKAADLVLGQMDFIRSYMAIPADKAGLAEPYGIAVSSFGAVWVADSGDNRTLRFNGLTRTAISPYAKSVSSTSATIAWTPCGAEAYTTLLAGTSDYTVQLASASKTENSGTFQNLQAGATYYFAVKISTEPDSAFSYNRLSLTLPKTPQDIVIPPTSTTLQATSLQIYPNPFCPLRQQLTIDGLPSGAAIRIYTLSGELARTLDCQSGGKTSWDGRNSGGRTVAAGIYIALIKTPEGTVKRKLAVLK